MENGAPTLGTIELPKHLVGKFCPHLPPVPSQSPLNPSQVVLSFQPCGGEMCAKWDQCQGKDSPRAIREGIEKRDATLHEKYAALFDTVSKHPIIARFLAG